MSIKIHSAVWMIGSGSMSRLHLVKGNERCREDMHQEIGARRGMYEELMGSCFGKLNFSLRNADGKVAFWKTSMYNEEKTRGGIPCVS